LGRFTGGGQVGAGAPPTTLIYELIDSHVAVGTESTYTFTPATAIDPDDVSAVIVRISGEASGAFNLELQINAETDTQYINDGFRLAAGVETILRAVTDSWILASTSVIDAANINFAADIELKIPDSADSFPFPLAFAKAYSRNGVAEWNALLLNKAHSEISAINIFTSASTWKAGTKIDTYQVLR